MLFFLVILDVFAVLVVVLLDGLVVWRLVDSSF